jgi:peptidoglycan hydrolase CwlO-like protein
MPDSATIALFLSIVWPSIGGAIYWGVRRKATAKAEKLDELTRRTEDFDRHLKFYRDEVEHLRKRIQEQDAHIDRQDVWIGLLEDKVRSLNAQLPVPPWATYRQQPHREQ